MHAAPPRPALFTIYHHRYNSRIPPGFQYSSPAKSNHPSANEHPDIISGNLETEIAKGRLLGPLQPSIHSFIHTSSLGAIPKKHSDKWRLILDYPTQCITVLMMVLTIPHVLLPI